MTEAAPLKPLIWVRSSRADFGAFPEAVKDRMAYALYVAQQGGKHADAKPLKGFGGAGVIEIIRNHKGDTFRAVYTVRLADAVYVLHAFKKKSKTGRETPKADIDMIERRMREVERISEGETR
jgi:phage-related protein